MDGDMIKRFIVMLVYMLDMWRKKFLEDFNFCFYVIEIIGGFLKNKYLVEFWKF